VKAVHLTKIRTRHARVLARPGLADLPADIWRLLNVDIPELVQALYEAKQEAEQARSELRLSKEAGARYSVTVYSDSPMRVSRVEAKGGSTWSAVPE
jgi:hypothetical protein